MAKLVAKSIAKNLGHPGKGIFGWFVNKVQFEGRNVYLEENAVRLSQIQPHHQVLEVGFGPGIGLQHAYKAVQGGSGKIYGAEISTAMIKKASGRLKAEIQEGKVQLFERSVTGLPFDSDTFDRVYHVNCFYFWSEIKLAVKELHRVMKPESLMVATLSKAMLEAAAERGLLNHDAVQAERYMEALNQTGFIDIRLESLMDKTHNKPFEVIYAQPNKKK